MKQIAILSGKGGTGKTTLSLALSSLIEDIIIADCDVDASDMFIVLKPQQIETHDFIGGQTARIDPKKCINCNKCYEVCRFDAVKINKNTKVKYSINPFSCEGCRFCERVCPESAISTHKNIAGKWFISKTRFGQLVHARLNPGEENSGKLVTMVRHQARDLAEKTSKKYIIIDGPPGIGCPVISTLSGVDLAIIVTEPTLSAVSDLERVIDTAKHFNVAVGIVINKHTINKENTEMIINYANNNSIPVFGKIPFNKLMVEATVNLKTLIEYAPNSKLAQTILDIEKNIKLFLGEKDAG